MLKQNIFLAFGALALLAAGASPAHSDGRGLRPVPQLNGVWKTRVTILDCQTRTIVLAGPFAGLITFAAGGTISESAPALPNSGRGPSHGEWNRTGRNTFAEAHTFQRFDVTGILLGSQEIRATVQVADDSLSYKASDGTFETKDLQGSTLAKGCAAVEATRFR